MLKKLFTLTVLLILAGCSFINPKPRLNEQFSLEIGKEIEIEGEQLFITFLSVAEDSRCRFEIEECSENGQAVIRLRAKKGDQESILDLADKNSIDEQPYEKAFFLEYEIQLKNLPYITDQADLLVTKKSDIPEIIFEDSTPVDKLPETTPTPDFSKVKIPDDFEIEKTAYTDIQNQTGKLYSYKIAEDGSVNFVSFKRAANKTGDSRGTVEQLKFDYKITNEELGKIYYYYEKINFASISSDYSVYNAANCGFNSNRPPYLFDLNIRIGFKDKRIKFLEFCNKNENELKELFQFMKKTEEISFLKPHIKKAF